MISSLAAFSTLIQQIIVDLNKTFALKTLGSMGYFSGSVFTRSHAGIMLTDAKYISYLLKKAKHQHGKCKELPYTNVC